ncbi:MAG: rRNA maturation RNase YbeY [Elusimicrobia bacterium]|nr:rRNA maturation RNase YbeY [Elusimicrobiota bacterium]
MNIRTHFKCPLPRSVRLKKHLLVKTAAAALKRFKTPGLEVNLVLAAEREIRKINKSFLNRTCVTDVIAFNYHPGKNLRSVKGPKPFGDIYICAPRAKEQAAEMGHSLLTELLILSAHGALHLAGLEDDTPQKRTAMNAKTARLLKKLL